MQPDRSERELAVVLVSGGMDSCVTAAIAAQNYELAFLHINYGHRTEKRELQAFEEIADFYRVKRRLICDFEHLRQIGGSSLIDSAIEIPEGDLSNSEIPTTYVPFRNAHLLSVAVSWAEVIGATKIFIGAVQEDSAGYPDCRKDYYRVFNELIKVGTKPETHIEVITPLIDVNKEDIVKKGMELGAPFHLTWSCYKNTNKACGSCDSCLRRLRGFRKAGFEDPIEYAQNSSEKEEGHG